MRGSTQLTRYQPFLFDPRGLYRKLPHERGFVSSRIVSSRGNLFPSNGWLRDLQATAALPSSCLYLIKLNYNKQAFISFWDKKNIFTPINCIAIKFILLKPAKGKNVNWIWERTITRKKEGGESTQLLLSKQPLLFARKDLFESSPPDIKQGGARVPEPGSRTHFLWV